MRDRTVEDPVGVWRSIFELGNYRFREVIWPELFFALLLGAGGAVAVIQSTRLTERTSAVADLLGVSAALLAVVFAALAIVVALPASRYLAVLGETEDGGMRVFLEPYLVAAGTQIAIILVALAYRMLATHVPAAVEHGAFYALGFLFVFGLLDIANLARQLVRHGIFRAADAAAETKNGDDTGGQVHPFESRR
jgi:ABC-type Fe3+-siderophore transport system permease subunit